MPRSHRPSKSSQTRRSSRASTSPVVPTGHSSRHHEPTFASDTSWWDDATSPTLASAWDPSQFVSPKHSVHQSTNQATDSNTTTRRRTYEDAPASTGRRGVTERRSNTPVASSPLQSYWSDDDEDDDHDGRMDLHNNPFPSDAVPRSLGPVDLDAMEDELDNAFVPQSEDTSPETRHQHHPNEVYDNHGRYHDNRRDTDEDFVDRHYQPVTEKGYNNHHYQTKEGFVDQQYKMEKQYTDRHYETEEQYNDRHYESEKQYNNRHYQTEEQIDNKRYAHNGFEAETPEHQNFDHYYQQEKELQEQLEHQDWHHEAHAEPEPFVVTDTTPAPLLDTTTTSNLVFQDDEDDDDPYHPYNRAPSRTPVEVVSQTREASSSRHRPNTSPETNQSHPPRSQSYSVPDYSDSEESYQDRKFISNDEHSQESFDNRSYTNEPPVGIQPSPWASGSSPGYHEESEYESEKETEYEIAERIAQDAMETRVDELESEKYPERPTVERVLDWEAVLQKPKSTGQTGATAPYGASSSQRERRQQQQDKEKEAQVEAEKYSHRNVQEEKKEDDHALRAKKSADTPDEITLELERDAAVARASHLATDLAASHAKIDELQDHVIYLQEQLLAYQDRDQEQMNVSQHRSSLNQTLLLNQGLSSIGNMFTRPGNGSKEDARSALLRSWHSSVPKTNLTTARTATITPTKADVPQSTIDNAFPHDPFAETVNPKRSPVTPYRKLNDSKTSQMSF